MTNQREGAGYFLVDRHDRVLVRVTEDAEQPASPRYVKLWADSVKDAFRRAGVARSARNDDGQGSDRS